MSKTRVFRLPGSSIFVRQNNVEDLLGPKGNPLFKKLGYAFALLIVVGNCSIPIAILVFGYGR